MKSHSMSTKQRLWVRLISIAIIIAIALLKPRIDQWLEDGSSPSGGAAIADSGSPAAGTEGSADFSLEDLLRSVRESSDESAAASDSVNASAGQTQSQASSGAQTTSSQTKSKTDPANAGSSAGKSTAAKSTNPKTNPGSKSNSDSNSGDSTKKTARLGKLTLVKGTRDQFRSTAGLLYLRGSADGHRLKHVLQHAKNNPDKAVHGVFDGDREQIQEWIDEAYLKGRKGGKGTRTERQRDRLVYTVDMGQRIGYVGGQAGKRKNNPECRYLKLVLENKNEVITAYPSDRL